jgi:Trypsin
MSLITEGLSCSGTLIAPDVFLTAAHCTFDLEQFGLEFRGVTFDNAYDPGTSVVYPGTLHVHTDFDLPGPNSDATDIAVVVLDEEVAGIQPALLRSAGLLDQLANDGDLKGQRSTARTPRQRTGKRRVPLFLRWLILRIDVATRRRTGRSRRRYGRSSQRFILDRMSPHPPARIIRHLHLVVRARSSEGLTNPAPPLVPRDNPTDHPEATH